MQDHILHKAEELIETADRQKTLLVMVGFPLGTDTSNEVPRDEETLNNCTRCGQQVLSTVVKDAVLHLTMHRLVNSRPVILCDGCHKKFVAWITPKVLPQN